MNNVTIAVLQSYVDTDKSKNLEQAEKKIRALEKVDIVVLPEMFTCPYHTDCFPIYAEKQGQESWQRLSQIAKEKQIYLIAGSIPERDGNHIYNTSYVFDREGRQIARHRKMHLFDINVKGGQYFKESDTLTPGQDVTVFSTEFGVMGLCICYDFRFPELSRLMVDQGAKILFVPASFNMTTGPLHWELLFRQRAVDNQVFTVGASPCRNMKDSYHSWGHSILCDPWGKILKELDEKEGMWIQTIDLEETDRVREQLPLLQHRRKDIYKVKRND